MNTCVESCYILSTLPSVCQSMQIFARERFPTLLSDLVESMEKTPQLLFTIRLPTFPLHFGSKIIWKSDHCHVEKKPHNALMTQYLFFFYFSINWGLSLKSYKCTRCSYPYCPIMYSNMSYTLLANTLFFQCGTFCRQFIFICSKPLSLF